MGKRNDLKYPKEYKAWENMRSRCNNPNMTDYHNYGGRGIKVCARWDSFENFLSDLGLKPSNDHSLDRIDVNKNYTPNNCRWATRKQQMRNTRLNKKVGGISLRDKAEELGMNPKTLDYRLKTGKPVNQPVIQRYGLSAASRETGIPVTTLRNRMVRNNLTLEEAKLGTKKQK